MAEELVRQSVFDRLTGSDRLSEAIFVDEPPAEKVKKAGARPAKRRPTSVRRRLPRTWEESVAVLKRNVLRDLEQLFNARQISEPARSPHEQLERSVYNYGLRDVATFAADSSAGTADLQKAIETTIALFEPRIKELRVKLVDGGDPKDPTKQRVRFVVSGTLRTEPDPEQIEFDTVLESTSRHFEVSSREINAG